MKAASQVPSYEQSCHHPHSRFDFSSAHRDSRDCPLHSTSRLTLNLNSITNFASFNCQFSSNSSFSSLPPPIPALPVPSPYFPQLSLAFAHWQRYLRHHIDALAHYPPVFSVSLSSTPHSSDEKCSLDAVRLTLDLSLASLGLPEARRSDIGLTPDESLLLFIDVGRDFSHKAGSDAITFELYVQVGAGREERRGDQIEMAMSPFPWAHLLRYRIAELIDGYTPLFPAKPQAEVLGIDSFPGCVEEAVRAWRMAGEGKRSLLAHLTDLLPMNPVLHIMREVQKVMRLAVGHVCCICASPVKQPKMQRRSLVCDSTHCAKQLVTSPVAGRLVWTAVQRTPALVLDFFLNVAVSAGRFYAREWGWNTRDLSPCPLMEGIDVRRVNCIPSISELRLYDEAGLTTALGEAHTQPLLCWLLLTYRCHLFSLHPAYAAKLLFPCVAAFVVTTQPKLFSEDMQRLFHLLTQAQQSTECTRAGWSPPQFISLPLYCFHTLLERGPVLSRSLLDQIGRLRQGKTDADWREVAPLGTDEALRARRWDNSELNSGPFAALLLCELVSHRRLREETGEREAEGEESGKAEKAEEEGRRDETQREWVMRAIFLLPVPDHGPPPLIEDAEDERWSTGRSSGSERRKVEDNEQEEYMEEEEKSNDEETDDSAEEDDEETKAEEERHREYWRYGPSSHDGHGGRGPTTSTEEVD